MPQDAALSSAAPPPPCLVAVPRTEFRQPDPELLPGRPLAPAEMYAPAPVGCGSYVALFFPFFARAVCSPEDLAGGFLLNMPELQIYTRRSKRWIYRGLRVLAAHGILYSTRVGPEEGRDRRRYRVRYWLRCDAQISAAETAAALQAIFSSDPDDDDHPFPADAPWVGRGRAIRVPPEALAQAAARAAGAPPPLVRLPAEQVAAAAVRAAAVPEIVPLDAISPASPLDTRQESQGIASPLPVASSPAAPGPEVGASPVAPVERPQGMPPAIVSRSFSQSLLDRLVEAVESRFGVARPHVIGRADGPDGLITIERAANYRHREVFRDKVLEQHAAPPGGVLAPTQLEAVNLPEDYLDFISPEDKEFQPGLHGWNYIAGCWHGPVTVCRCFVKEFVEEYLRATGGATVAAS